MVVPGRLTKLDRTKAPMHYEGKTEGKCSFPVNYIHGKLVLFRFQLGQDEEKATLWQREDSRQTCSPKSKWVSAIVVEEIKYFFEFNCCGVVFEFLDLS